MDFLSKHKKLFLSLGMVICLGAIILTLNTDIRLTVAEKGMSYLVVPVQTGVTSAVRWIGDKFAGFSDTNRLVAENSALQEEIDRLKIDNQRLSLLDEENKKLSALLSIAQKYAELPTVGAEVIAKDPTDWYDSFNINLGEKDGIRKNMSVLGDNGLVGVVREVQPNFSKVVSIIDSRCSVAAKNLRTDDIGVVKGDVRLMQQGLCRMDYIHAEAQILQGDEIYTSEHSAFFPPGVLIGMVLSVEPNADGLTKYAIIQPAASIDDIETVLVVNQLYGDENATEDEPVFLED